MDLSSLSAFQSVLLYLAVILFFAGAANLIKHIFEHTTPKKVEELPVEYNGTEINRSAFLDQEAERSKQKRALIYDKLITMYRKIREEYKDLLIEKKIPNDFYTEIIDFIQFDFISREILFMKNGLPCVMERILEASDTCYRKGAGIILGAEVENILDHFFWVLEEKIDKSYNEDVIDPESKKIIESIISCREIVEFYKSQAPLLKNALRECFVECAELDKKYGGSDVG